MNSFKTTAARKGGSKKGASKKAEKGNGNGHSKDEGFDAGPVNTNIRRDDETTSSRRRAVQADLPGTEDRRIKAIHEKAMEYIGYRDERMSLGAKEVKAKGELLDLMHAHKKEQYICEGIEVVIQHEKETIKVKVAKGDEETDEAITGE